MPAGLFARLSPASARADRGVSRPVSGDEARGGFRSNRQPAITIVSACLNSAATLARSLDSTVSQDYRPLEVIVIDGGSTDGTLEILLRQPPDQVRFVSEPDEGISDAFNKGIRLSRGEYIGILAADDWYEPGAVRKMVDALETSGADVAHGALQYWQDGKRSARVMGDHGHLRRRMSICHPTVFVRRDCFDRFGFFRLDYRYAMDYEWLLRALVGGAKFVAVNECITNMDLGGASDRNWRAAILETARARAEHLGGRPGAAVCYAQAWADILRSGLRRSLERMGLAAGRRAYHRLLSKGKVDFPER